MRLCGNLGSYRKAVACLPFVPSIPKDFRLPWPSCPAAGRVSCLVVAESGVLVYCEINSLFLSLWLMALFIGSSMCLLRQSTHLLDALHYRRQFHVLAGVACGFPRGFRRVKAVPCDCRASAEGNCRHGWGKAVPCACMASRMGPRSVLRREGNSMCLQGQLPPDVHICTEPWQFHAPVGSALFRRFVVSPSLTWITAD